MIAKDGKTVVVAETACAHEGDTDRLLRLVDCVSESSADAIKFHGFTADGRSVPETQYHNVVSNLEISPEEWYGVIQKAKKYDLKIIVDVFDIESAELMSELGIDAFKIHAADIQNIPLLRTVAKTGKPLILYVGGATKMEIYESVEKVEKYGSENIILMYGLQNYPTSFEDSNLRKISQLKEEFKLPIGYASHTPGGSMQAKKLPAYAVAAGADLIECHFCLNRKNKRVDYISSLNPNEFEEMVRRVREIDTAVGTPTLNLSTAEKEYRQGVRKALYTKRRIGSGCQITEDDVVYLRGDENPNHHPVNMDQVIGKYTVKPIEKHTSLSMTDIDVKTTAVLACRSESTRLYGKPFQLLDEKSILQHIVDGLRTVPNLDEITLAIADTPSQSSYIEFADRNNLSYVIGPEIDVLQRCILAAQETSSDFVVKANTENPYVAYDLVEKAISTIIDKNADLVVMENLPLGSAVDTVSTQALVRSHKYGDDRHRSEFTSRFILENTDSFNIECVTPPYELQRPEIRLTVDYPEDLVLARKIMSGISDESVEPYLSIQSLISFLDKNPEIMDINKAFVDGTEDSIKQERPFAYGNREA